MKYFNIIRLLRLAIFTLLFSSCYFNAKITDLNSIPNSLGLTWTAKSSGFRNPIVWDFSSYVGINFYNGRYYLRGTAGVQTSTDGIQWTQQGAATDYMSKIKNLNGNYVAYLEQGNTDLRIFSTIDFLTFNLISNGPSNAYYLNGLEYGNGKYVALTYNAPFVGLYTSSDLVNWTQQTAANTSASFLYGDITFGNGLFVIAGASEIETSSDGINWTTRDSGCSYRDIYYGNSNFIAVGASGCIKTSSNGTTWNTRTAAGGYGNIFYATCIGNGLYLAAGANGEIQTSPDGVTWSKRTPYGGFTGHFKVADCSTSKFFLVGDPVSLNGGLEVQTSTDGITWSKVSLDYGVYSLFTDLNRIKTIGASVLFFGSGNGIFSYNLSNQLGNYYQPSPSMGGSVWNLTTNGSQYLRVGTTPRIQYSSDLSTWTNATPAAGYTGVFTAATFSIPHNQYVIAGSGGEIQTSPDGVNWTKRPNANGSTNDFYEIAYNGLIYVLGGTNGEIQTSPDGVNWTKQNPDGGYTGTFRDIIYDGYRFLIVGSGSEIQTSVDGVTWKKGSFIFPETVEFRGVEYCNGVYVVVGDLGLYRSVDLLTWNKVTISGNGAALNDVTCNDKKLFIVGNSGTFLISE